MGGCVGSTGVDTNVEFGVWLKTTAQVGPIVLRLCYDKVATHKTAIFCVIYGKLRHTVALVLLNKNVGLLSDLLECTHGAYLLD
jgi:chromosome condensin MukBEF ATPase and DNA-binding subunit MukB